MNTLSMCPTHAAISSSIPKKASSFASCVLFLLLCAFNVTPSQCLLNVKIASGQTQCFAVLTPTIEKSLISGYYEVFNRGLSVRPLQVTIHDEGKILSYQSEADKSEGQFHFTGSGKHRLCISNGAGVKAAEADDLDRTVGFSIHVSPSYEKTDVVGPTTLHDTAILKSAKKLTEKLSILMDHVEYLKLKEAMQFKTAQDTGGLVLMWTYFEAFVLVGISIGQVCYLRKFI